jgi:hypothetical protein
MFEFLRFGRDKKANKAKETFEPVSGQPKKSEIRIEMIRLALKSVLRRYGIPIQWIGAEIVPMSSSGDSGVLLTQLVVRQWHDEVMRFAPELQNQLSTEIQFFDSTADPADFQFVWKFMPDCGYTNEKIPEPGSWAIATDSSPAESALPVKSAITEPAKDVPAAKFELPKSKLDDVDQDNGFAPTQIFEQK